MNLFEMHARESKGFVFTSRAQPMEKWEGTRKTLGFTLLPDDAPQIIIENVFSHRPLRCTPPDCGWILYTEESSSTLHIVLRERATRYVINEITLNVTTTPTLLPLPWPALSAHAMPDADIEIHVPFGTAPVFLRVSYALDRKNVVSLCHGKGVEIGPGIGPQVLPAADVDVLYAEEKGREDWLKTYAYKMDKYDVDVNALPWERYHTRPALDIPADDNSLDFIFSSHVFEHVVNPIGHLQHWLSKLKSGGIIAGIMPHADYSVDYQMNPSHLHMMALEYQRKETTPNINHYRAQFGDMAEQHMAEGRTLHVHFYNERNLQDLFSVLATQFPIAHTRILWERNYKEFFFVMGKK